MCVTLLVFGNLLFMSFISQWCAAHSWVIISCIFPQRRLQFKDDIFAEQNMQITTELGNLSAHRMLLIT